LLDVISNGSGGLSPKCGTPKGGKMDSNQFLKLKKAFRVSYIILPMLLLSCSTHVVVSKSAYRFSGQETLLIVPFHDMSQKYDERRACYCNICDNNFHIGKVEDNAVDFLTNHLKRILRNNASFKILLYDQKDVSLGTNCNDSTSAKDFLIEAGRLHNADTVVTGNIFHFKQLEGKGYGATSPASVIFDLHVFNTADGRVAFSGMYNEKQVSLSENFLMLKKFIQRKARWLTVEELSQSGLEEMLKGNISLK
jgi:hypothetical protein